MKYIILEHRLDETLVREIPIIFPNCLTHSIVAECLMKSEELVDAKPVAAGFIDFDIDQCHGSSESLGLKSRGTVDRLLIGTHDYLHGIK